MHDIFEEPIGNGIGMYDWIPEILENDPLLKKTNLIFWVGVLAQRYPSPPVPRTSTKNFASCPVFIFRNQKVFKASDNCFYKIPDHEEKFIQARH